MFKILATLLLIVCLPASTLAENITIATAANFKSTLEQLVLQFETRSNDKVIIISASSGVLFTQIKYGAPFDIFLSADAYRPEQLFNEHPFDTFVYAIGQLVFWVPGQALVDRQTFLQFEDRIAIANPLIAPYGSAAIEILNKLKPAYNKLVRGKNINQAFQFVESGNAGAGILSLAQLNLIQQKNFWPIPGNLHTAIEQKGILLSPANAAAIAFVFFLKSNQARHIITEAGYRVPAADAVKDKLDIVTIRD